MGQLFSVTTKSACLASHRICLVNYCKVIRECQSCPLLRSNRPLTIQPLDQKQAKKGLFSSILC